MDLYFRADTLELVNSAQFPSPLTLKEVVRGDTPDFVVRFVDYENKVVTDPFGAGSTWLFSCKAAGEFGSDPLTSTTSVTRSGAGTTTKYVLAPNLNTTELNAAMSVGGETELPYLDTDAQFQITLSGKISSTAKFTLRINNDIARADDPLTNDASNAAYVQAAGDTMTGQLKFGEAENPVSTFTNVKVLGAENITKHAKYFALDGSVIDMDGSEGLQGHASFACTAYITGTHSFDHHHAFQDMSRLDTTGGTLTRYASYYSAPVIGSSAVVSDIAGFRALTPALNGSTGTYYGYYTDGIAGVGAASYAFYSAGAAPSVLGGPLTASLVNATRASTDGVPYFTAKYSDVTGQWSMGMDVGGTPGDKRFTVRYYNGTAWQNAGLWIDVAEGDRLNIHKLRAASLPTYADETAATTGGLSAGDIYKTATGELRVKL